MARWPDELRVVVPTPGGGCQQCWEGKYCSDAQFSARNVKLSALCVEISENVKEPASGQNYSQSSPEASLIVIVAF